MFDLVTARKVTYKIYLQDHTDHKYARGGIAAAGLFKRNSTHFAKYLHTLMNNANIRDWLRRVTRDLESRVANAGQRSATNGE